LRLGHTQKGKTPKYEEEDWDNLIDSQAIHTKLLTGKTSLFQVFLSFLEGETFEK